MKKFEVNFKFIKAISLRLNISGLILIALGILIIVFPQLLAWLVAIGLIISGISSISLAHKVNHYSKIKIDL